MVITGDLNSKQREFTMDIYNMEKITAFVNHELEQFTSHQKKWIHYVMPHISDFVFTDHQLYYEGVLRNCTQFPLYYVTSLCRYVCTSEKDYFQICIKHGKMVSSYSGYNICYGNVSQNANKKQITRRKKERKKERKRKCPSPIQVTLTCPIPNK